MSIFFISLFIYLKNQQKKCAINKCKYEHVSIFDAVHEQMKYVEYKHRDRAAIFSDVMIKVASATSYGAISILLNEGYGEYIEEKHLDINKVHILQMLAKQEPDIKKFLVRLKELEAIIQKDVSNHSDSKVVLSTIHTSKGLEYDTVYMVDVFDGRFPSSRPNLLSRAKDNADGEQEERRLFYVGITRAKNNLHLFAIKNYTSIYINELFPEFIEAKRKMEVERNRIRMEEVNVRQKRAASQATRQKYAGSEVRQTIVASVKSPVEPKALPPDRLSLFSNVIMRRCKICGHEGPSNDFWTWQGELGECYNCKK